MLAWLDFPAPPRGPRCGPPAAQRTRILQDLMASSTRLAWLFDVDGTLLLTEGAAREAFARAVGDHLGVGDDLHDIGFAGRIEPLILRDILRKHGRSFDSAEEARFWDSVFAHMHRLLLPGRGRLMPGILKLLDRIAAEPGWVLGLLTGNMTQMARIKLAHFGLDGRFAFGGFGEMAPDRDALARALVRRVGREYGVPAQRCVVVGDTEHDVACARAAGARVIAVATGGTDIATLAAAEPDLLLDDLQEADAIMRWAGAIAAGE
jgi:phosphoglycolate phosphatase